jgi:parvulin-like peptidyl-prolyl isomerase
LSAILLFTGCTSSTSPNTVVATVGDTKILYKQFSPEFEYRLAQYGITDVTEYDYAEDIVPIKESVLDSLIAAEIQRQLAAEFGITADEEIIARAKESVQHWYNETLESIAASYESAGVDEPLLAAKEEIEGFMSDYGLTLEMLEQEAIDEHINNMLYEKITSGIQIDEAVLLSEYESRIETDRQNFMTDLAAYTDAVSAGIPVFFTPAGVFNVKHILISLPEEDQNEITRLRQMGEDEEADIYREAALDKILFMAIDVYEKTKTEDFDTLIYEYGEDPGMMREPTATNGYPVYEGCTTYVPEFTEAALLLLENGDISSPTGTDFGFHIIKRISTETERVTPFEEVRDYLDYTLSYQMKADAYRDAVDEFKASVNIERFIDRIR